MYPPFGGLVGVRRRILTVTALVFLLALAATAQGQRQPGFEGFGDDLPPASLEGQEAPALGAGPMQMPEMPPPTGQQVLGYDSGMLPSNFQGFGGDLPPADMPQGMDLPAAMPQGVQGMDPSALMGMLGNLQGQGGMGFQLDYATLAALLNSMQGTQGLGGAGMAGQADINQLLQMLAGMYGVSAPNGIDPAMIQQGMANLREMQTWEGMEGIDFDPLMQLLEGNTGAFTTGQWPQYSPEQWQELLGE